MEELSITYEMLFETLQREKEITELQKLERGFFNHFAEYINEKNAMLNKDDAIFSTNEKKKIEKQIENATRIIKDLYEKREKKLINLALIKSRTKSIVIDTSSLLENERVFFDELVKVFDAFRNEIVNNLINGKYPLNLAGGKKINDAGKKNMSKKNAKSVRFLFSVPKFVGKELEEYGPFGKKDIAQLPTEIADVLISNGSAEEVVGP